MNWCLIDLIAFYDKTMGLVEKETSMIFFILYFSRLCKAFVDAPDGYVVIQKYLDRLEI